MEKTSKSLTQTERRELSEKLFSDMIQFTENLQNQNVLDVNCLTKLEELQLYEKHDKITHSLIDSHVQMIVTYMCKCFPQIENQLTLYWNAWASIFKKHPPSMNIRETIEKNLDHIMEIDSMYKEIINQKPENDNVAFYAVLNAHVSKCEKIEYSLKKDLDSKLSSTSSYDTNKIFSAGEKMPKGSGYVTHGIALRDAISHKKYTIDNNQNDSKITFANSEYGYGFREIFTKDDFIHYIKSTDMLYRIMFMLQTLIILSVLLHESIDIE